MIDEPYILTTVHEDSKGETIKLTSYYATLKGAVASVSKWLDKHKTDPDYNNIRVCFGKLSKEFQVERTIKLTEIDNPTEQHSIEI